MQRAQGTLTAGPSVFEDGQVANALLLVGTNITATSPITAQGQHGSASLGEFGYDRVAEPAVDTLSNTAKPGYPTFLPIRDRSASCPGIKY